MNKFSKKTVAVVLVVTMLLALVPSLSFADEPAAPMMILKIGSDYYTSGDEFTAELWVYNADFNVTGFCLEFDPASVKLSDGEDFYNSVLFNEYLQGEGIFQPVPNALDADNEKGIVKGVFFVSMAATDAPVIVSPTSKDSKLASVGSDGLLIATIKFVAQKNGKPSIGFTTIKGDVDFANKSYILAMSGVNNSDVTLSLSYAKTPGEDAYAFIEQVNSIGEVTLEDAELIDSLLSEYGKLDSAVLDLVAESKAVLDAAKAALDELMQSRGDEEVAQAVIDDLTELSQLTGNDLAELEAAIKAVKDAYEALTDAQKAIVDANIDSAKILEEAQAKLDAAKEAAKEAAKLQEAVAAITEIANDDEITIEDSEKVKAAKALYDALSDESKNSVDEALVKALSDALAKLEELEGETIIYGDVDGDKDVNIMDAIQILRYLNNKKSDLTDVEKGSALFKAADVSKDGAITITDAIYVLRFINGKISSLGN